MSRFGMTASALTVLAACAAPEATAVDPFDTTALPRLETTEQLRIGSDPDAGGPVLYQVSGAILLGTGELAVSNAHSEILVFGPRGELRRTLGREGGGPGEFRFLQAIARLDGDRILAWDPAQARATVFGRDGTPEAAITPGDVDLARVGGGFVGAFGDGRFVLEGRPSAAAGAVEGLRRDTIPFLLFGGAGALVRTIGRLVTRARPYSTGTGYKRYLLDTSVHAVLAGGELLAGENDSLMLMRFDSSGAARPALGLDRPPRPVTDVDVEAGWRAWVERQVVARQELLAQAMMSLDEPALEAMRRRIRADVEAGLDEAKQSIEPAGTLPAYRSILVGSDGSIWVEDYLSPALDVTRWMRMSAGFSPSGWIELPSNDRLLAAGRDRLVILRTDESGIESVVVLAGDWPSS